MPWKLVGNLSGPQGERGEQGVAVTGPEGPQGPEGRSGKDGIGVAGAVIDRSGNLTLTLSDGSHKDLGCIVGAAGRDGKDGADGLGFDDLSIEFDGERTAVVKFAQGERTKEFPLVFAVPLYRGVYKEGDEYKRGDTVTWGGSLWIAQQETKDKPETAGSWQLAVKRGRDGKDGILQPERKRLPVKVG